VTDEELMLAVRDGDLARLGLLFDRYHVVLFDFLSRMTGNSTAAEDLVQDIFVRILKYRATYRDDGRFETWLFRIARNARADYFRGRPPVEPIAEEALEKPETAAGPARLLEQRREVMRLRRALLMLRDDKRELIVLARYREMTHEQIASLLGVEIGTVKVRLHRAVRELREIFLGLSDEASSWNVKTSAHTSQTI
jgi:RNA polymerase sigma-70 factor (ECF subfamily)